MFGGSRFVEHRSGVAEGDYEKAKSALDDLASKAPDEIKADVETAVDALTTLMEVFESVDLRRHEACARSRRLRRSCRTSTRQELRMRAPASRPTSRRCAGSTPPTHRRLSRHSGPLRPLVLLIARCPMCRRPDRGVCARCVADLGRPPRSLSGCRPASTACGPSSPTREGHARSSRGSSIGTLGEGWLSSRRRWPPSAPDVALVTWVPTTAARSRERGLRSGRVAGAGRRGSAGRPCRRLLRRSPGPPQTGRPRCPTPVGPLASPGMPIARPRRLARR